ncbi:MAG: hypothetical protein SGJ18_03035 [Pseudomonadota bacterium]|nr:hypothetical protein [Pseudomonadota bacterium]
MYCSLESVFRKVVLIFGLSLVGCSTTGPVKTQINTNKNPIVSAPADFQSPLRALDFFGTSVNGKSDKETKSFAIGALKTLTEQQEKVFKELSARGKLLLQPGLSYEFTLESFCVNAGVERPVVGDGLFLGDLEGAPTNWLPKILNEYKVNKIPQNVTQVLIWGLLSGAKFDELSVESQQSLLKIFPDASIRFGNSMIQNQAESFLFGQIPGEVFEAKDKWDNYKNLIQDSKASFESIEKTFSPESSRKKAIPVGWIKNQDGYFIHLTSDGYQRVKIKIYAPENLKPGTYFEPTKMVALPGEGQRLALSNHVVNEISQYLQDQFKTTTNITFGEADFVLKHPLDAYSIYLAANKAKTLTWKHFPNSKDFLNDRADAFRHFVWSGLITHEIGEIKAKNYLDAHEDFPSNPVSDKNMDLFNNQQGIEYGRSFKSNNFENDLIQEGHRKIDRRELKWLK